MINTQTLAELVAKKSERERLAALYGYNITSNYEHFGTFKHVARMATRIFHVPIAVVNFVDEEVVRTNSSVGLEVGDIDRGKSICSLAVLQDDVTVYENAKAELCLLSNPFVHGDLGIAFYAAAPIRTPDGHNIGVVAIADKSPQAFSKEKRKILQGLAAIVMQELEERKALALR